ncbi:MAG: tyrosine-type recombinase/integrase [Lachnospira sp.]|nr:tyrosine-type recombinase/integrase [Lachnospira sp.]
MNTFIPFTEKYLEYCKSQKKLDNKTIKAYRIDLKQFATFLNNTNVHSLSVADIENFIGYLHRNFKPKTVKRKLASLKAFFHYLEYKSIIKISPFNKIKTKFREPLPLPKIFPLHTIENLLSTMYKEYSLAHTAYRKKRGLLDIAVSETLFSTGMRISELCNLKISDVELYDATQLSDQSIRRMIKKYCSLASINLHITPHMFRHTFATSLLDADVDIRYIQEMLGHSSITVTEIYTHVALSKQKDILTTKHPRQNFKF